MHFTFMKFNIFKMYCCVGKWIVMLGKEGIKEEVPSQWAHLVVPYCHHQEILSALGKHNAGQICAAELWNF